MKALTLTIIVACFVSCRSTKPSHTFNAKIDVSSIQEDENVNIYSSDFLDILGQSYYSGQKKKSFTIAVHPNETIILENKASVRLLTADNVTIQYDSSDINFKTTKPINKRYNDFYRLFKDSYSWGYSGLSLFIWDNKKQIFNNEKILIDSLEKCNKVVSKKMHAIFDELQLDDSLKNLIEKDETKYSNIKRYESYLQNYYKELDSMGVVKQRYDSLITVLNDMPVEDFIRNNFQYIYNYYFRRIANLNIYYIDSAKKLQETIDYVAANFTGRIREYANVKIKAISIKNKLDTKSKEFAAWNKEVKNSTFYEFIKIYVDAKKQNIKAIAAQNDKAKSNLYTLNGKFESLENILAGYKNKPLLVDFWASWCGPCYQQFPIIAGYATQFSSLNIVMVSFDKYDQAWKDAVAKMELKKYPNYRNNYNNKSKIVKPISGMPTYGLLLPDGELKLTHELSESVLKEYLSQFK